MHLGAAFCCSDTRSILAMPDELSWALECAGLEILALAHPPFLCLQSEIRATPATATEQAAASPLGRSGGATLIFGAQVVVKDCRFYM